MHSATSTISRKVLFAVGLLCFGWAAQAQSTDGNTMPSDTVHRMMHHRWANHNGNDSLYKKNAFHRGPGQEGFRPGESTQGNWAFHQREQGGFGPHREGFGTRYTPEQRRQIAAINKEYKDKSAALFKQDNITLGEYKAGLVGLQKEKKNKMEALLTQRQRDQIAVRKRSAFEDAQVMAAARMERLKLHLNLTDDQVAKIKAGEENLHNQMKAIHENDNLLPQQKMEQMKNLMMNNKDIVKSVLTPEQLSRFEEMHHHFVDHGHVGFDEERGPRPGEGMNDGR